MLPPGLQIVYLDSVAAAGGAHSGGACTTGSPIRGKPNVVNLVSDT
jgi:hypothetical protein